MTSSAFREACSLGIFWGFDLAFVGLLLSSSSLLTDDVETSSSSSMIGESWSLSEVYVQK